MTHLDPSNVSLRAFPYPFRAALAISSDIDETRDTAEFLEIQRFLNTKQPTSMGVGVGLDISNSFYFFDNGDGFAYFSDDPHARGVTVDLIHAGYIDTLHSYGHGATSRDQVLRALDELTRADCRLDVWVNHYDARSNFAAKFEYMFGDCLGDLPGSPVYHSDVTLDYGIKYVWVGAMTRVAGQAPHGRESGLATVWDPRHAVGSGLNILRETRKNILGRFGDSRFRMGVEDRLMMPIELRDGRRAHEFRRYCNHPHDIGVGATSRGLAYAIRPEALRHLERREGFMVVYTHLGKNDGCGAAIAPETQDALRTLAEAYEDQRILVSTTSRLLNYYRIREDVSWKSHHAGGLTIIDIEGISDPLFGTSSPTRERLQGLTFYVADKDRTELRVGGVPLEGFRRNERDHLGLESVSIPFEPLTFPC